MNLSLIYIASGFSRRFGGNKLLAPFKGKPLFQQGLQHLQEAIRLLEKDNIHGTICVVTQYDEIIDYCQSKNIPVVKNANAKEGMASSIRVGVVCTELADGWAIFATDQPFLDGETIADFLRSFAASTKTIGTVTNGKRRGSPAAFLQPHKQELLALRGDIGGRNILRRHEDDLYLHPVISEKLLDIDTKDTLTNVTIVY